MKPWNLFSIQLLICIYFLFSNAYTELVGDHKEEVIIQGAKSIPPEQQQNIIDQQSQPEPQPPPPKQQPYEPTIPPSPTSTSFNCSLPKYKIDLALLAATSDNDIKLVTCLLENGFNN